MFEICSKVTMKTPEPRQGMKTRSRWRLRSSRSEPPPSQHPAKYSDHKSSESRDIVF